MEGLQWEYEASHSHLLENFLEVDESGKVACAERLAGLCQRSAATETTGHEIGIAVDELSIDQGARGLEARIGPTGTTEGSIEAGGSAVDQRCDPGPCVRSDEGAVCGERADKVCLYEGPGPDEVFTS